MLFCLGCFQDFVLSYCSYTCDCYAGMYCAHPLLEKIAWLADVPAKGAVVPPSVFAKEQPASSAPRDEEPQKAESKPLPEEAPGSAQGQASRMLNETQVRFGRSNRPSRQVVFVGAQCKPPLRPSKNVTRPAIPI